MKPCRRRWGFFVPSPARPVVRRPDAGTFNVCRAVLAGYSVLVIAARQAPAGRTRHAAPDEPQGQAVKDQITADIVAGSAKAAPAVVGSAVSAAQGLALADVAVMLTILYTGILTATTVIKNWGLWMEWWAARVSDVRRFAAWVRRRG